MLSASGLVILDFDGVIADSLAEHRTAYTRIFEAFGKPVPFSDFRLWYDSQWENNWLKGGFLPEQLPMVVQSYFQHVNYDRVFPFPEIKDQLTAIRSKYRTAIASTSPQYMIAPFLERHGLDRHIERIYTFQGGSSKKELIESAMRDFGTVPSHTVMAGDTSADIRPAKELGCLTAGICYGWYAPERIELEAPQVLIRSPAELAAKISIVLREILEQSSKKYINSDTP